MEITNWPSGPLGKLRNSGILCSPEEINSITETMLSVARERLLLSTAVAEPDPCKFINLNEFNLFNFKQDPTLEFNYNTDDINTHSIKTHAALVALPAEKKLLAEAILLEAGRSSDFSTIRIEDLTRIHHVSHLANNITYFVQEVMNKQRNYFIAELFKSRKLVSLPYEQILWSIDNKKREKPGEKIFVFMYDEWLKYFTDVYIDNEKIKKEINGACIIGMDQVYFRYNVRNRFNLSSSSSPKPYSAAIIAESEITWNVNMNYTHNCVKVPRRLQSFIAINYRPVFKIL